MYILIDNCPKPDLRIIQETPDRVSVRNDEPLKPSCMWVSVMPRLDSTAECLSV